MNEHLSWIEASFSSRIVQQAKCLDKLVPKELLKRHARNFSRLWLEATPYVSKEARTSSGFRRQVIHATSMLFISHLQISEIPAHAKHTSIAFVHANMSKRSSFCWKNIRDKLLVDLEIWLLALSSGPACALRTARSVFL